MFKRLLFFLMILAALIGLGIGSAACAGWGTPTPTPSAGDIDAAEMAVYAVLLKSQYTADMLVIMDQTATGPGGMEDTAQTLDYVLKNMHDVAPGTVNSFQARNAETHPLRADMPLGVKYLLLSQAEMNRIFAVNQDGWQVFYERYPKAPGILTLSRVGFNDRLDQALVYLGGQSHWLAGAGHFYLMKKVNGAWTIDQKVMTWIS